jgi:hypothetical protein
MSLALQALMAFDGTVECSRPAGAVNLVLRGRAARAPAEALFAGAAADALASLPASLHAVRLLEYVAPAADGASRRLRLESQELQLDLVARSLQLHRDVAAAFFAAVPPPHVPFKRRLGWAALLSLLRIPGVAGLLAALRRRT